MLRKDSEIDYGTITEPLLRLARLAVRTGLQDFWGRSYGFRAGAGRLGMTVNKILT